MFPWIPTFRNMDASPQVGATTSTVKDSATRTATVCYMRGLKESNYFLQNDGSAWQWRRVCFTLKGPEVYSQTVSGTTVALQTTSGYKRVVNDALISQQALGNQLLNIMFKGTANADWNNVFNAPLDTERITVKYDRFRYLTTGNQNGRGRTISHWMPMNKNLHYDDEENGGYITSTGASSRTKAGMGDYYVVDFMNCPAPQQAGSASTLDWSPSASLYWHEK